MSLENEIDKLVEAKVAEILSGKGLIEYEALSPEQAAEFCGCGKSAILDLIKDRSSGFPGAQLSPKVFSINKFALVAWLDAGGILAAKSEDEEETGTKLRVIK